MTKNSLFLFVAMAALLTMGVGCAKPSTNNQISAGDNASITEEFKTSFKSMKEAPAPQTSAVVVWSNNDGYTIIVPKTESVSFTKNPATGKPFNPAPLAEAYFAQELTIVKQVFTDRGFTLNKLNSIANDYFSIQAYEKGDELCTATIDMGNYSLTITCGNTLVEAQNQQFSFLDALKLKNTGKTVSLINQNGLFFQVYVSGGQGSGGGASAVLKKEGDKYRVLLFDNGLPSCDTIDKEKIPYDMLSTSGKGECFIKGGDSLTKTRLDSTVNWKTYTDAKVGFTFKYPEGASNGDASGLNYHITVNDLNTMVDMPLGYDKANALKDKKALSNGDPSTSFGWSVKNSLKMLNIPNALAKELTVLGQIDVCDVQFSREAIIYKDNYQIILSWWYGGKKIIENNPSYFTEDIKNCGSEKMWKEGTTFYTDLVAGITDSVSQNWFIDFDEIVKTLQFTK